MHIDALVDTSGTLDEIVEQVRAREEAGFKSAWVTHGVSHDALSLLALIGREVKKISLGTAVVPIYGRHPQALAQSALTASAAIGDRFSLGIGLSHRVSVETMWGLSFDRPLAYIREYLQALEPLLKGEKAEYVGERITVRSRLSVNVSGAKVPPVLLAALGPAMLELAGSAATGTITWMTGIRTIGDHIAPLIKKAAQEAGRPAPQIVVSLPISVSDDEAAARERVEAEFAWYGNLPSYRAMLDREGAKRPSDVALVGKKSEVRAQLERLKESGATNYVAAIIGTRPEREATLELLSECAPAL